MDRLFKEIHRFAESVLKDAGSHGMDHTDRVTRMCRIIGRIEGADMNILIPAALLHDIARPREKEQGLPHETEGARMAARYLASVSYPANLIPAICDAIRTHRFRSEEKPVTLEGKILSDADKLDALGAAGIARTFMRAGEHGGTISDAVDHFNDKLLKLKAMMYTQTGREIATERHAFLLVFLETLAHESEEMVP